VDASALNYKLFSSNYSQLRVNYPQVPTTSSSNGSNRTMTIVAQRDCTEDDGLKSVLLGATVSDGVVSSELLAVSLDGSTGSLPGVVGAVGSAFRCLEGAADGGTVMVQQVALASICSVEQ
jgi:hypothetical protein